MWRRVQGRIVEWPATRRQHEPRRDHEPSHHRDRQSVLRQQTFGSPHRRRSRRVCSTVSGPRRPGLLVTAAGPASIARGSPVRELPGCGQGRALQAVVKCLCRRCRLEQLGRAEPPGFGGRAEVRSRLWPTYRPPSDRGRGGGGCRRRGRSMDCFVEPPPHSLREPTRTRTQPVAPVGDTVIEGYSRLGDLARTATPLARTADQCLTAPYAG